MGKLMKIKIGLGLHMAVGAILLLSVLENQAHSFGSSRSSEAPTTQHHREDPEEIIDDGYDWGHRNGSILVDRLVAVTVARQGCSAMNQLERAILRVTSRIEAPRGRDGQYVKRFYRGYLDALREGVREVRRDCDDTAFLDGDFAGELYGNILCSLTSIDVSLAEGFETVSLYNGWSGGSELVLSGCQQTLTLSLETCVGQGLLSEELNLKIEQSCSDNLLL